jgi:hypothetical protein
MSFSNIMTTTKADVIKGRTLETTLRKLPQYVVCSGLGLIGGAIGVAIAIALAIVIQARIAPTTTYFPGLVPLSIVATLAGLGVSWLMGRGLHRILPSLSRHPDEKWIQVVLVFSVFASLLETFLFIQAL